MYQMPARIQRAHSFSSFKACLLQAPHLCDLAYCFGNHLQSICGNFCDKIGVQHTQLDMVYADKKCVRVRVCVCVYVCVCVFYFTSFKDNHSATHFVEQLEIQLSFVMNFKSAVHDYDTVPSMS